MNTCNNTGYLLLFSSNESYKKLPLEEIQKLIALQKAWFESLAAQGKIQAGQPLARRGATVTRNGQVISDGPFAESKEAIGGYLLLNVGTFEEAIAIAKSNPGLAYGNSIEVRPVTDECPLSACARELADARELATA